MQNTPTDIGLTEEQTEKLCYTLDRLALCVESADPRLRAEAKRVAKQNLSALASELHGSTQTSNLDRTVGGGC